MSSTSSCTDLGGDFQGFGRDSAARMEKDGIDAKLIVDRREPSGTALILVDAKGQNVISVALGANGALTPKDIAVSCSFRSRWA